MFSRISPLKITTFEKEFQGGLFDPEISVDTPMEPEKKRAPGAKRKIIFRIFHHVQVLGVNFRGF